MTFQPKIAQIAEVTARESSKSHLARWKIAEMFPDMRELLLRDTRIGLGELHLFAEHDLRELMKLATAEDAEVDGVMAELVDEGRWEDVRWVASAYAVPEVLVESVAQRVLESWHSGGAARVAEIMDVLGDLPGFASCLFRCALDQIVVSLAAFPNHPTISVRDAFRTAPGSTPPNADDAHAWGQLTLELDFLRGVAGAYSRLHGLLAVLGDWRRYYREQGAQTSPVVLRTLALFLRDLELRWSAPNRHRFADENGAVMQP